MYSYSSRNSCCTRKKRNEIRIYSYLQCTVRDFYLFGNIILLTTESVCICIHTNSSSCICVHLHTNMGISNCMYCYFTVYIYYVQTAVKKIVIVLVFVGTVCVVSNELGFLALTIVYAPSVCIPFSETHNLTIVFRHKFATS